MDFTYVCMYMHSYIGLPHMYHPIIQNKHILHMQTGYMLASFSFGGTNSLVRYTGVVVSFKLTYNGARDLYACMEQ